MTDRIISKDPLDVFMWFILGHPGEYWVILVPGPHWLMDSSEPGLTDWRTEALLEVLSDQKNNDQGSTRMRRTSSRSWCPPAVCSMCSTASLWISQVTAKTKQSRKRYSVQPPRNPTNIDCNKYRRSNYIQNLLFCNCAQCWRNKA